MHWLAVHAVAYSDSDLHFFLTWSCPRERKRGGQSQDCRSIEPFHFAFVRLYSTGPTSEIAVETMAAAWHKPAARTNSICVQGQPSTHNLHRGPTLVQFIPPKASV